MKISAVMKDAPLVLPLRLLTAKAAEGERAAMTNEVEFNPGP
jgi:hypothetical protein